MKNFEVTYTKGHLVDKTTGKRVFLKRGGSFTVLGDDNQFEEKDELEVKLNVLGTDQKLQRLSTEFKNHVFVRCAESGERLVYRIGLRKTTSEEKTREFVFDAILLEDLYIKSRNGINWSLCDCLCETRECVYGDVQMVETVRGLSLSNLFSNMVAFYFPLQRSGSTNALEQFFFSPEQNPDMHELKHGLLKPVGAIRGKYTKAFDNFYALTTGGRYLFKDDLKSAFMEISGAMDKGLADRTDSRETMKGLFD